MIPNTTFNLTGRPLAELGLEHAVIRHVDGHEEPLGGFLVPHGMTVLDALMAILPPGATLLARPTATQKPTAMELSQKKLTSSKGRWYGRSVIYGKEDEHATPFMTRYWLGRLRLHIFHRGDQDPDCHDHPWDFWTFPLNSYVEEVALPGRDLSIAKPLYFYKRRQIVPAFRLTFRPATHCHSVLGRWNGRHETPARGSYPEAPMVDSYDAHGTHRPIQGYQPSVRPGPIVTFVWRSHGKRDWGFLKDRDGRWCYVSWREYVFGGGKSAPCE